MKKTLITLAALALASVAQAVDYPLSESFTLTDFQDGKIELKHALDFTKDFEISGSITIGTEDANQWGTPLITTNTRDVFGSVSDGGFKLYLTDADNGLGDDKLVSYFSNNYAVDDYRKDYTSTMPALTPGDVLTFTYTYTAATMVAKMTFSDGSSTDSRSASLKGMTLDPISVLVTSIGTGEATSNDWAISLTVKSVPEPATATLSLLALAGLAARRRRK